MSDTRELLERAIGAGYQVGEMIGRGGFGEVYVALDRSLNRSVAIKVLRADVADSRTAVDRFRREAEALARLRHPHIMPVYGIGEGQGITYFVMPRIEGESLADLMMRSDRLSLDETCRVIAETADALAAAHRAGIIHRDIKPDNILLEGEERHALLMDFGIARSTGNEGGLTATGMIIGTPTYMSPEQATGDKIGPSSDIYSLGVVAYELLAGRPLFAMATSPQHVITAHLTTTPDDLRGVNPEVPASISRAVMRCLRKDPAERWPAVADFVKAFSQARADLPRDAHLKVPEAAPPLSKRAKAIAAAVGVVGLAATFAVYRSVAVPDLDVPHFSREAARAEAESLMGALALPHYRDTAWTFSAGGTTKEYLRNRGIVDPAVLSHVTLGEWRFAFYTKGKPGYARLSIGSPGWVSRFDREMDTSATGRTASDSGRIMTVPEALRAMGWDPDSLKLVDSTRGMTNGREQRTWAWTPALSLAAGVDTATRRVEATFTNGRLTSYTTNTRLPAPFRDSRDRHSTIGGIGVITLLILIVIVVAVDVVHARKGRTLRIDSALRFGVTAGVFYGAVLLYNLLSNAGSGAFGLRFQPEKSDLGNTAGMITAFVVFLGPLVYFTAVGIAAVCETLAVRRDPTIVAGFQVLTSRPTLRRIAAPLPWGVAFGLALGGFATAAAAVAGGLARSPLIAGTSWIEPGRDSITHVLMTLCLAPPAAMVTALVILHLLRLRSVSPRVVKSIAALLAAIVVAATAIFGDPLPNIVMFVVIAAGVTLLVGWRGVVEAMVAFVAATMLIQAALAWRAPYSNAWPATIVLGLLIAGALASAFVRVPTAGPSQPSPSPRPVPA